MAMSERRRGPFAAVAVLLLMGRALAAEPSDANDPTIAEGRALAEALCATCHLRGNQSEKAGSAGIPGFRAIARRPGQSADGIVTWLLSMPPMMPNHHLTRDEMDKVAAYILSLARK